MGVVRVQVVIVLAIDAFGSARDRRSKGERGVNVSTAVFRWGSDCCRAPVRTGFSIARELEKKRTKGNQAVQNREADRSPSC